MGITRQTVNKAINAIDAKVSRALLEAAQLNRIEISRMNPEKGFLLGRSFTLGLSTLITFSDKNGIQLWYKGEGQCPDCERRDSCKEKLITEAKVRNIRLPKNSETMQPTKLADLLFKKIMKD